MLIASVHLIVHVNATLNAAAAALLLVGLALVRHGRVTAHKRVMLTAFTVSVAFLACYVWYHYHAGHVAFTHPGAVRYAYLAILASHVLLALTVPVLALRAIYLGLRATGSVGWAPPTNDSAAYRRRHRRLAHWTFPIWLYVSVTGVVVYVMLYHLWPPLEP